MTTQETDAGHSDRRRVNRAALAGWLIVLVCSLLVYDALLFSSLSREIWNDVQASARVAADNLRLNVTTGVRFGKNLESYRGLDSLLAHAGDAAGMPLAVLDARGNVLLSCGEFPSSAFRAGGTLEEMDGFTLREDEGGRTLIVPVNGRDGKNAGYIGVRIDRAPLDADLYAMFRAQLAAQGAIALGGALLLACLFAAAGRGTGGSDARERLTRSARLSGISVFLLVMLANGALALHAVSSRYTESLEHDAARTGALLTEALNRLLLVGVSFERMDSVGAYLSGIAAAHDGTIALEILNPRGVRVAGSAPEGTALLPEARSFPLLHGGGGRSLHRLEEDASGWNLRVSIVRGPWLDRLRATALDMLTMVAVSLIFMMELFFLFTRGMELLHAKKTASPPPRRSALLRPLAFFMLFAMDMSISFIPLRMAELVPVGSLSRDMLLGLPISAEMGMTGLSVLLAGAWVKRSGARPPLMTGLALVGAGYLGSMLAASPWQFVAARAVVGTGYGLALLAAQACTVKDGMLADMFAGVYAGSLCGSAMGAMLAERFGYAPVFMLSAVILICLVPLPRLLLQGGTAGAKERPAAKVTFGQMRRLLGDRRFLAFVLLSLVPSAMLCVGFLNYFLPVYLKSAGAAQSDIGRIYMLNCLLVIYSGPPLSRLVMTTRFKAGMVCAAGIIAALSLLALAVLPPLPATLLGAVLVGLATGLNIPAQSEYLLRLDIARAIGVDQSMSLLDALQRVGQVLGPLCAGAALLAMGVDEAALRIGAGFILISLAFLLLARPGRAAHMEEI